MKQETFAERVRACLAEKGLTQADVAKASGLSATHVSRLLTGDRSPTIDNVTALAGALGTTATELIFGTDAGGIFGDWVSLREFEEAEQARAAAQAKQTLLEADVAALEAENAQLREELDRLTLTSKRDQQELLRLHGEVSKTRELEAELLKLQAEVRDHRATSTRLKVRTEILQRQAISATELANANYQAWALAHRRVAALEKDLVKSDQARVGTAVVAGAIGAVAAAMLASPASTSRKGRT